MSGSGRSYNLFINYFIHLHSKYHSPFLLPLHKFFTADTSAKHIKESRPVVKATHIFWAASQIIRLFPDIQEGCEGDRDPAWGLKKHQRRKTFEGSISAGFCFLDSQAALVMEKASNYGVTVIWKVSPTPWLSPQTPVLKTSSIEIVLGFPQGFALVGGMGFCLFVCLFACLFVCRGVDFVLHQRLSPWRNYDSIFFSVFGNNKIYGCGRSFLYSYNSNLQFVHSWAPRKGDGGNHWV